MEKDVRGIQLVELEILTKIKEICEKHNLRYYLVYGTLLGAIRHNGFIPWDDDADIMMPAPDYIKFCIIAQKELGDDYFFQNSWTDQGYHYLYGKVLKNNTSALMLKEKDLDINWGIYVDVFPLISYSDEKDLAYCKKTARTYSAIINTEVRRVLKYNETLNAKFFDKIPTFIRRALGKIYMDKLLRHFEEGQTMRVLLQSGLGKKDFDPKSFFEFSREMMFENQMFSVPSGSEQFLESVYGDYMTLPPIEKRLGHERYGSEIIFDCNNSYKTYKT